MNRKYFDTLHNSNSFLYNFYKTRFLGCCMAFNRKVLKECLPFPRNIVAHDYWIGMYWLFKYHRSVYFLEEILMCYRRHGGNVSTSSEKSNNSFLYKILIKRFYLLKSIIKRFIKIQFKRWMSFLWGIIMFWLGNTRLVVWGVDKKSLWNFIWGLLQRMLIK